MLIRHPDQRLRTSCGRQCTLQGNSATPGALLKGVTLMQRNAVGVLCKASSFWDGSIHKSRLEPVDPSSGPSLESWRYMDGGMMVGQATALACPASGGDHVVLGITPWDM